MSKTGEAKKLAAAPNRKAKNARASVTSLDSRLIREFSQPRILLFPDSRLSRATSALLQKRKRAAHSSATRSFSLVLTVANRRSSIPSRSETIRQRRIRKRRCLALAGLQYPAKQVLQHDAIRRVVSLHWNQQIGEARDRIRVRARSIRDRHAIVRRHLLHAPGSLSNAFNRGFDIVPCRIFHRGKTDMILQSIDELNVAQGSGN